LFQCRVNDCVLLPRRGEILRFFFFFLFWRIIWKWLIDRIHRRGKSREEQADATTCRSSFFSFFLVILLQVTIYPRGERATLNFMVLEEWYFLDFKVFFINILKYIFLFFKKYF